MDPDRQLPAIRLVPELAAFRADLEALGYVVVPHGEHICVRLPQFVSVVVRYREGELEFVPQFGPLHRHHSSALTLTGSSVVVGALALTGFGPVALGAAFLGVMLAARDLGRYIVSEGCLTRLQMLWASRRSGSTVPAPAQSLQSLGEGAVSNRIASVREP